MHIKIKIISLQTQLAFLPRCSYYLHFKLVNILLKKMVKKNDLIKLKVRKDWYNNMRGCVITKLVVNHKTSQFFLSVYAIWEFSKKAWRTRVSFEFTNDHCTDCVEFEIHQNKSKWFVDVYYEEVVSNFTFSWSLFLR